MADDILVAGLDTSGFSPEKKKNLQEFVAIFQQLEKYHGKAFAPLSGAGLGAFNQAATETNMLLSQINLKLGSLNSNVPFSRVASSASIATKEVRALKDEVAKSNGVIDNLSASARKAFSYIRYAAYILPGIGIAGIFTLAFDAIEKFLPKLLSYGDGLVDITERQGKFTKALNETIELLKQSVAYIRDQSSNQLLKYLKEEVSYYEKMNFAMTDVLAKKLELSKLDLKFQEKDLMKNTGQGNLNDAYAQQLVMVGQVGDKLRSLNLEYMTLINSAAYGRAEKDDRIKERGATLKGLIDETKKYYDTELRILNDYDSARQKVSDDNTKLTQHNAEEKRKIELENVKNHEKEVVSSNKKILDDDRSTLEQRLDAIKSNYESERRLIDANLKYQLGQPNSRTLAGDLTSSGNAATKDAGSSRIEANNKYLTEIHKVTESYRQRDIKANSEMTKEEIEEEAIKNERISRDLNKSLNARLAAYIIYIAKKKAIQDVEYERDIEKEGLTDTEKLALDHNRLIQKKQLEANSAREIYDIVFSWGQKQLKDVESQNKIQATSGKELYISELKTLNKSYEDRLISYAQYKQRKKFLDAKVKPDSIETEILNDKQIIKRTQDHLKEQLDLRNRFGDEMNATKGTPEFEKAEAKYNAISDIIKGIYEDLSGYQRDLSEDEYKQQVDYYNKIIALEKEHEDNKKKIREEGYVFASTLLNTLFQNEVEKVEKERELYDEQNGIQEAAIERSSLNAKNKTAYEIQLEQQKIEFDKNSKREEAKLKRQQAEFEKKLALARIAWNTQVAITSHLGFPPLIIDDIILGALAAATVIATDIPGYEHGTQGKPHEGGFARVGEKGKLEMIKEKGKPAYFVNEDQIINLSKGAEVFPMNDTPVFSTTVGDNGWEQTMMIVSAIKKQKKEIKNIIKPVTKIDMGWESYKNRIFNG